MMRYVIVLMAFALWPITFVAAEKPPLWIPGRCFWIGSPIFCYPGDCPSGSIEVGLEWENSRGSELGLKFTDCWFGKKKRCCTLYKGSCEQDEDCKKNQDCHNGLCRLNRFPATISPTTEVTTPSSNSSDTGGAGGGDTLSNSTMESTISPPLSNSTNSNSTSTGGAIREKRNVVMPLPGVMPVPPPGVSTPVRQQPAFPFGG